MGEGRVVSYGGDGGPCLLRSNLVKQDCSMQRFVVRSVTAMLEFRAQDDHGGTDRNVIRCSRAS